MLGAKKDLIFYKNFMACMDLYFIAGQALLVESFSFDVEALEC